jgi:hypothetical protein
MFGLSTKERNTINAAARAVPAPVSQAVVIMAEPEHVVPKMAAPTPIKAESRASELAAYAEMAKQIGLPVPELEIERFRSVLADLDFPIYSLNEVVAYMDDKAKREGEQWGWRWLALREKDRYGGMFDGRFPNGQGWESDDTRAPSSDLYRAADRWGPWPLYSRTVPLHALQRIAAIEVKYDKPVHFMVSDYAPQPQYAPDPFLLAVIPNEQLSRGIGRFVIDFWDEPGFGITSMLK